MKSFCKAISALPFAGKFGIRALVFGVYQATSHLERSQKYRIAFLYLIFMAVVHALQAKLGQKALGYEAPIWADVIFALYLVANVCVAVTQMCLLWRVTIFHFTKPVARFKRDLFFASNDGVVTALVATLGGQVIFFALYLWFG